MLKDDGGIRALLEMVRSGSNDVIAQVARGMANFAKCESRGIVQGLPYIFAYVICIVQKLHPHFHQFPLAAGRKKGRSLLMEDGALTWLINNSHTSSASTRRHIELALCHLAQNGKT